MTDTVVGDRAIVEFVEISKTYDGVSNVVEKLDLTIRKGEFLTLLGPSGSGKTTLLMMLAGFEMPTDGEVRLNGRSLNHVPAYKRNMGVVFQSYALFPHMTVAKNVGYPLVQRGVPRAEIDKRVGEALAMIHMADFAGRMPTQLSGGQQQRVALARALVHHPDVVLMDEPLGALDKKLREHMQIEIKHLHEKLGMTVVYVTHDQTEALTMSNRIAVFNRGRILQIGTPEEIYERPVSSFVANFIGETNNFAGTVAAAEGAHCEVDLPGGRVRAANIGGRKSGERVTVAIRPERMIVRAGGGAGIAARVVSAIYHGDHLRYEIDVPGAASVMAKVAISSAGDFGVGDAVTIGWDPSHARALDPES
jgi:putative spermidine/putrescine transport system ATP-binding protein